MAPKIQHGFRLLKWSKVPKSKPMERTDPFATDKEDGQKTKTIFQTVKLWLETTVCLFMHKSSGQWKSPYQMKQWFRFSMMS